MCRTLKVKVNGVKGKYLTVVDPSLSFLYLLNSVKESKGFQVEIGGLSSFVS